MSIVPRSILIVEHNSKTAAFVSKTVRAERLTVSLAALIVLWTCFATAALGEETPVERFKRILESPPVIESLVYTRTLPPIGQQSGAFLGAGLAGSTNRECYEVRWQPNGLLHRQLTWPQDAAGNAITGRCFSLWNDHFYFLDAKSAPSLYVLELNKAARGIYPDPYHAAHIRIVEAVEPLNLGVSHIYPGTVRWQGDRFTVMSMADKRRIWVRGAITELRQGVPTELKVQYSNDLGVAQYRIAYEYPTNGSAWFPSRIAAHFIRDDKEILYSEYRIVSVKTAASPFPESWFNLAPTVVQQSKPMLFLTNNSTYARLPSGWLVEAPRGLPALLLPSKAYRRIRVYYLLAGTWTLVFLVLSLRTRRGTKLPTSSGRSAAL